MTVLSGMSTVKNVGNILPGKEKSAGNLTILAGYDINLIRNG